MPQSVDTAQFMRADVVEASRAALVNNIYIYTFPDKEDEQEISIEVNFWS